MIAVFRMLIVACLLLSFSADAPAQKPLKVYILSGQSNMQGHAHVRTLPHLKSDPATAPLLELIQTSDGQPRVADRVWISYLSNGGVKQGKLTTGFGANEEKIGPELTFGLTMAQKYDGPILIIKTAWGGKSINTDFRPPSAGPYEFNAQQREQMEKRGQDVAAVEAEKREATGHYYRLMIDHVQNVLGNLKDTVPAYDPQQGYELAGFVWFQGWNDMVDGGTYANRDQPDGYQQYDECLTHFIRDVRRDLKAPELPFVIGVMGVGGPVDQYLPDQQRYKTVHQNFRDAQASAAKKGEFKSTVANVLTENYWDMELRDLRAREAKLRQQLNQANKEQSLDREQEAAMREKLWAEEFTDQERKTMEIGVSNAEYHYLGSSKILGQIGKAFAEAMVKLEQ